MASKTYEVAWRNAEHSGDPFHREVVPATTMGAALAKLRFRMDIERGGAKHEAIDIRVTRVS